MTDVATGDGKGRFRARSYPERRETLFEWPVVVAYDVPKKALRVTAEHFTGVYLWYTHGVCGGGIPTYLYGGTNISRNRGTTVAVKAFLKRKFFADGREVDYLDLEIVPDEPTHDLVFVRRADEYTPEVAPTYSYRVGDGMIAVVPR